jgi:hypothetical protein
LDEKEVFMFAVKDTDSVFFDVLPFNAHHERKNFDCQREVGG